MAQLIDVWDAFMVVKSYCASTDDCTGCPLYKKNKEADCQNAPFTWDIRPKEGEEK